MTAIVLVSFFGDLIYSLSLSIRWSVISFRRRSFSNWSKSLRDFASFRLFCQMVALDTLVGVTRCTAMRTGRGRLQASRSLNTMLGLSTIPTFTFSPTFWFAAKLRFFTYFCVLLLFYSVTFLIAYEKSKY